MKVHYKSPSLPVFKNAVITIGTFDGVHLGHRKIITRLTEVAKQKNGTSVVVTFNPHPRIVLFPEQKDLRLLTSSAERAWLLEKAGWKIKARHKWAHPVKKIGLRPLLRTFTPRYYIVYAERN